MSYDKENPSEADESLADKRMNGIANFLVSRHVSNIKGFNLAYYAKDLNAPHDSDKREPTSLNPAQAEPQVILKNTIAALSPKDDLRVILRRGGPSKAIVMAMGRPIHN
jgi:hypothetical protein